MPNLTAQDSLRMLFIVSYTVHDTATEGADTIILGATPLKKAVIPSSLKILDAMRIIPIDRSSPMLWDISAMVLRNRSAGVKMYRRL
mmetsp:Transcript_5337/g.21155  ORF Transcript_5337/g.21155 Transcript_5337/m.21155 type:complete len:87 (-) Transcript_5337:1083-1343(-)|eukprot:scaffold260_cov274-Pinguiococcus_pyrenoidosus.AAC.26